MTETTTHEPVTAVIPASGPEVWLAAAKGLTRTQAVAFCLVGLHDRYERTLWEREGHNYDGPLATWRGHVVDAVPDYPGIDPSPAECYLQDAAINAAIVEVAPGAIYEWDDPETGDAMCVQLAELLPDLRLACRAVNLDWVTITDYAPCVDGMSLRDIIHELWLWRVARATHMPALMPEDVEGREAELEARRVELQTPWPRRVISRVARRLSR